MLRLTLAKETGEGGWPASADAGVETEVVRRRVRLLNCLAANMRGYEREAEPPMARSEAGAHSQRGA